MTRESLDEDDDVPFDEFHVTEIEGAMQKLLVSLLGHCQGQKYSRLRCLLRVKGLVIGFYLGWSGSILRFRKI